MLPSGPSAASGEGSGRLTPFLGPAFIASVAYVDPGNFATNMAGGAKFGYLLLWVVLVANLMAMLIQSMSAKLGIATGMNLPEVCRERFSRRTSFLLWIQAELIAMATDIAEFVGAAIGINLLTGLPLFPAALLTGVAAFTILGLQARGFRKLEAVIAAFVGVIVVAFGFQVFLAEPSASGVVHGLLVPGFDGTESVLLAVGILGATCMPHVIYLHSALTQRRIVGTTPDARRRIYRFELVDVVIAMTIAGLINISMLVTAAAVFHSRGLDDIGDDLGAVYDGLDVYLGSAAAVMFGVALLASGLSSSSVGTMAGQVVIGRCSGATTWTSISRARNAAAASRPMKLAPITIARRAPFADSMIARQSASERRVWTCGWSAPGIGSFTGSAPVARSKRSKGISPPPAMTTLRALVSIETTSVLSRRSIPASA